MQLVVYSVRMQTCLLLNYAYILPLIEAIVTVDFWLKYFILKKGAISPFIMHAHTHIKVLYIMEQNEKM